MSARHTKRPRGYVAAKQDEFVIDGGFRLIADSIPDWQRIADEKRQAEEREEQAAKAQLEMF